MTPRPGARYIWQLDTWPALRWDERRLLGPLGEARFAQGRLFGGRRYDKTMVPAAQG